MKKLLFMLLTLIVCVGAKAQEVQTVYDITVTAQDDKSGVWLVIGEENLANVEELTLTGTINSYDFMVMRDKMPNLTKLDMTNVRIVANDYQFYSGCYTRDDELPERAFYLKSNFNEIKLPTVLKSIGNTSFYQLSHITSIELPSTLEIIGGAAFESCIRLADIDFSKCNKLQSIGGSAFSGCGLKIIRIPKTIKEIGKLAFSANPLTDVYVQPIIPRQVPTSTFLSIDLNNVTLHVPPMTKDDYYWATTWSGFGTIVEDVNPDYFYVDADLTIAEGKADDKTVDADVEANGGIINEDNETQAFDELNVANNGTNSGSLIANDNITANNLCFNINVTGNRWYFFSFPFRVSLSNVEAPGSFVFRCYDGAKRALDGSSGWSALASNTEYLEPGVGYIFQCNQSGTLKIQVASPDFNWGSGKQNELTAYASSVSDEHASWNFVGNPLTCYYDIDDMHYNSPLTIWDGTKYVAYRPGDDNYQLHPFEAFFLQKPNDNDGPQYDKIGRMTYTQATTHHNNKAAAARRMEQGSRDRYLLNLVLSNGTDEDQTRVVFNEKTKMDYEMECDAAKFMSTEQVPQLFSVYANTRYAINERPQGEVMLGFTAPKAGSYTLCAERMDIPVVVKDLMTGITHELKNGEYTFETEAGTYESRFVLMSGELTAISNTMVEGAETESIYTIDGKQLPTTVKGINIVRKGNEVQKVVTK